MSPRRLRHRLLLGAGLLLAAALLQLARDAYRADAALQHAQSRLTAVQQALLADDGVLAAARLRGLQADARRADHATHGPLWSTAAAVPWLGRSAAETATLTRAVQRISTQVVPRLLVTAHELRSVVHGAGNHVDLAAVRRTGPGLDAALAATAAVASEVEALPRSGVLPVVGHARDRLQTKLNRLVSDLRNAVAVSRALPGMLGEDGPRRYFVAFQNNAESRGTGGLLGAYAILLADHGHVSVQRLGSDVDLAHLPPPRVDLGADYQALFGHDARDWPNANLSGHFPYAAQLWLDMWLQRTGERLDGAMATDPTALSHVLSATGAVPLPDGSAVTAANVVARTESLSYAQYAQDDPARKQFLVAVAQAVLGRLLGSRAPSRSGLVHALARSAGERRLLVYSAHPAEEQALSGTAVSGEIPEGAGPFALLLVNNSAGNKIDYYLDRTLRYDLDPCSGGRRSSTLTAVLRNDVPAVPLTRFVTGRLDRRGAAGSSSLLVYLYLAQGARVQGATLDGRAVSVFVGQERSHPVLELKLELPRGQDRTIVLRLLEPAVRRPALVLTQPLVRDQGTHVRDPGCS